MTKTVSNAEAHDTSFGLRKGEVVVDLPDRFDASLYFIGRIRTPWHSRGACPKNGRESDEVCTIELDPRWAGGLKGLETVSHVLVLYWMDKARRDLAHTQVSAPVNAIVTRVDSLQPGQYLAVAMPALSLVATGRVWVEANPKETELTHVVPGQPAEVVIDGFPDRHWHAVVASVSPATGSEFAVLPAQNVSGNWIKVVQRISVRLRLEGITDGPPLRAGMSATVSIDTGRQRSLATLFQTTFARAGDTE